MADDGYLYDLRDLRFLLFEHLRADRLFELPIYSDFETADIELLLGEGLRFAKEVLAPSNVAGDREGCRFDNGKVTAPAAFHEAFRKQSEAGWMAISTSQKYGGQGLPFCFGAAVAEMFISANCSLGMVAGLTRAAADLLIHDGTDEMKKTYVPPMVAGQWGGTMCLTESHVGTALGDLHTTAVKRDGTYYLRGQKIFITGGEHDLNENIIHIVLARIEGAPSGTKGLSLFLVPKIRVDSSGNLGEPNDVACAGIEEKLGIHGSPTCTLNFGENDNCQGLLIGSEQQGLEIMFHMMNSARVGVGLQGVALGGFAYLSALQYARQRVQGVEMKNMRDVDATRVPIVRHPDVRRMLATMKAYVEGGRALLLHTAMCIDLSRNSPDESEREKLGNRIELLTPICKAYCSDAGFEVARLAVQTYGGHGYLKDYPVEQLLRDVKITSIYEGTNGVQAMDLLGRKVGRKQGALFIELMTDLGTFAGGHADHPELGAAFKELLKQKERLEQTTMSFGMMNMSGDVDYPLLSATPYLRMFGNVVLAWLLLEQAIIAHEALARKCQENDTQGDDAVRALCAEDADARFYSNKIKTAQFFTSNILTENNWLAAAIDSSDRSALEMDLESV